MAGVLGRLGTSTGNADCPGKQGYFPASGFRDFSACIVTDLFPWDAWREAPSLLISALSPQRTNFCLKGRQNQKGRAAAMGAGRPPDFLKGVRQ